MPSESMQIPLTLYDEFAMWHTLEPDSHFHAMVYSPSTTDPNEEFQSQIKQALRRSTFEGGWVRNAFCPVDADVLEKTFASLCYGESPVFSRAVGTHKFALHQWPESTEGKKNFYRPFVKILNTIVEAFQTLSPELYNRSLIRDLRFSVYDRTLQGSTNDDDAELEPSLLSSKVVDLDADMHISWHEVCFVGEIRPNWPDLVAQAGTYARCLFAATEHRIFVPILCLNPSDNSFRLCIFHRGGLLATTPMDLMTESGFREFVATIIGLWQWDTVDKAGFDPSVRPSHISLDNSWYRINDVLCRRLRAICSRATSVYVVGLERTITDSMDTIHTASNSILNKPSSGLEPILLQQSSADKKGPEAGVPLKSPDPAPVLSKRTLGSIKLPETFVIMLTSARGF
ncbi:hypothetical protein HGRIS_011810 [Hohenbuehelia grisea]|uniref:Fungal-type protein kinase domain-containing protein n=1 Tax=Hohenbuehelia grisea TaxID=104357 RepID=A0ABR3JYI5_9AGAR